MSTSEKTQEQIKSAAQTNRGAHLAEIPPEIDQARRFLEQYSGIAPARVDSHIRQIRDKAWSVFPYGCIGSFAFLNPGPTLQDPEFQRVLARLKAPGSTESFLDVGCCLGLVVRQLVAQGVASERLYGTDSQPHFLHLGYELFRDRDEAKSLATFVAANMIEENDSELEKLTGRIDIIYAADFFHLFERQDQFKAAKRMARLLNPENPGAMVFGRNGGPKIAGWREYILDAEGWQGLWDDVGEATQTCWRTEFHEESGDDWIKVRFGVYRLV